MAGKRGSLPDSPAECLRQQPGVDLRPEAQCGTRRGRRTWTAGGQGSVGEKAASALADFVVLDMVASVCTDRATIKDAIAVAERQAKRIYR